MASMLANMRFDSHAICFMRSRFTHSPGVSACGRPGPCTGVLPVKVAKIYEFIRRRMSVDHDKELSDEQRKEYEIIVYYNA